jgi:hypothetical protein
MTSGCSAIWGAIRSISSVAEQNSATTEQVAATTQEMTYGVEGIAASAKELLSMSVDLQEIINLFKREASTCNQQDKCLHKIHCIPAINHYNYHIDPPT